MNRKLKYDPKLHPQLISWMARAGLTNEEICKALEIGRVTLYRWRALYPKVSAALQQSRDFIDSLVEDALLKRALGFAFTEQTVTKAGHVVDVTKRVIPDVGAQALWLKNRRRPRKGADPRLTWQDTYRIETDPGNPDAVPIGELNNDELDGKIARLERALGVIPGEAPPPGSPGTPDTVH